MTERSVDITARIANLEQIQNQLKDLTVNVKFNSPQLEQLINFSKQGINIDVRLNFLGDGLTKLQELSKTGINLNVNAAQPNIVNKSSVGATVSGSSQPLVSVSSIADGLISQVNQLVKTQISRQSSFSPGTVVEQSLSQIRKHIADDIKAQVDSYDKYFSTLDQSRRSSTDRELKARFEAQASGGGSGSGRGGAFDRIFPNLSAKGQDFFDKQREEEALAAGRNFRTTQNAQRFFENDAKADALDAGRIFKINQNAQRIKDQDEAKQAVEDRKYAKANKTLNQHGPFTFSSRRQEFIDNGLDESKLVKETSFFDPGRLKNKEAQQALLFSGLLGGPKGLIGGAIGGSVQGDSVGVLGGVTVLGAIVSQFDKLVDTLKKAAAAGLEFEKSVAGTTGVLIATTTLSRGGKTLSPGEQLSGQQAIAEKFQKTARASLAPLGIGGSEEFLLTQAYIEGRRGKATESELKEVLPTLAAVLKPFNLGETREARELRDIVSGQRLGQTTVGPTIQALAPNLSQALSFGSEDDIKKAIEPLKGYYRAIAEGNEPLTQVYKAQSQLNIIQADVGESLLHAFLPGLKSFNDFISDGRISKNLNDLATAIGNVGSVAVEATTKFIKDTSQNHTNTNNFLVENAREGGLAHLLRGSLFANVLFPGLESDFETSDAKDEQLKRQQTNNAQLAKRKIKLPTEAGIDSTLNPQQAFSNFLNNYDLTPEDLAKLSPTSLEASKNNPFTSLNAATVGLSKSFGFNEEQGRDKRLELLAQQGSSLEKLQGELAKTFESGTFAGNQSAQDLIGKRLENETNTRDTLKDQLSGLKGKEGTAEFNAITNALSESELKLAQIRKDGNIAAKDAIDLAIKQASYQKQGIDTFTFGGKLQQAGATIASAEETIPLLQKKLGLEKDPGKRAELSAQIRGQQTEEAGAKRTQSNVPIDIYGAELSLVAGFKTLTNTMADLDDKAADIADSFADLDDKSKGLDISLSRLDIDRAKTLRERSDFRDEKELRGLSRGENILQAADKVAELGGNVKGLPAKFLDLVNVVDKTKTSFESMGKIIDDNNKRQEQINAATRDYNNALGLNLSGGTAKEETAESQLDQTGKINSARSRLLELTALPDNNLTRDSSDSNSFRKQYERRLAEAQLKSVINKNSDERGAVEDQETDEGFGLSLDENSISRGKNRRDKAKIPREREKLARELDNIPIQKLQAQFSFFKQAKEFSQQIEDINPNLAASLNKSFVDPALATVQETLGKQGFDFSIADIQKQQKEQQGKTIDKIGNRFNVSDIDKTKSIADQEKQRRTENTKNLDNFKDDLKQNNKSLSSLTKADLSDVISSSVTISLNGHFS